MKVRRQVRGLIIARRNAGEADRSLVLFTREMGLMRVVAKGVRRLTSRRGGHTEWLTEVHMEVQQGTTGNYIASSETVDSMLALRADADVVARVQGLCQLMNRCLADEERHAGLYDEWRQGWLRLPVLKAEKRDLVETQLFLACLNEGGLQPLLGVCLGCGAALADEMVYLDGLQGGWWCEGCGKKNRGMGMPAKGIAVLRWLKAHPGQAEKLIARKEDSEVIVRAIRGYAKEIIN